MHVLRPGWSRVPDLPWTRARVKRSLGFRRLTGHQAGPQIQERRRFCRFAGRGPTRSAGDDPPRRGPPTMIGSPEQKDGLAMSDQKPNPYKIAQDQLESAAKICGLPAPIVSILSQ